MSRLSCTSLKSSSATCAPSTPYCWLSRRSDEEVPGLRRGTAGAVDRAPAPLVRALRRRAKPGGQSSQLSQGAPRGEVTLRACSASADAARDVRLGGPAPAPARAPQARVG